MPKDTKEDLPDTIERSPKKAQRTYAKTLESAHEQYGDEGHRVASSENGDDGNGSADRPQLPTLAP